CCRRPRRCQRRRSRPVRRTRCGGVRRPARRRRARSGSSGPPGRAGRRRGPAQGAQPLRTGGRDASATLLGAKRETAPLLSSAAAASLLAAPRHGGRSPLPTETVPTPLALTTLKGTSFSKPCTALTELPGVCLVGVRCLSTAPQPHSAEALFVRRAGF